MEYFEYFPYLIWRESGKEFLAQDITIRIILDELSIKDKTIFYEYRYEDSDSLEFLAEKFYKDYRLAWVIMVVNKIFDRDFDLPMPPEVFNEYILDKYGTIQVAMNNKKYYIKINNSDWIEVDEETYNATTPDNRKMMTLYEVELEKNEKRRNIKILKETYLSNFINKFIDLLKV